MIFSIYDCSGVVYVGKGKDFSTVAVMLGSHRKLLLLFLGFSVSLHSGWGTSSFQKFISGDPELWGGPTEKND